MPRGLLGKGIEFTRGGLLGLTTDVLGAPVDMATTVMRPFGYTVPDNQVVGSSDWIATRLGNAPNGTMSENAGRITTGLLTPSSADITRVVGLLASTVPAIGKMSKSQDFSKIADVDPNTLVFREDMQNRTDEVRSLFQPGEGYTPITVIEESNGGKTILDGHNRSAVAMERGENLPAAFISREEYDRLRSIGFDDMEISYAALTRAKQDDAASELNRQFPGAGIAERGTNAWQELD